MKNTIPPFIFGMIVGVIWNTIWNDTNNKIIRIMSIIIGLALIVAYSMWIEI